MAPQTTSSGDTAPGRSSPAGPPVEGAVGEMDQLDALVALAALACGPGARAVINLLTDEHQVQLCAHGFTGSLSPRIDSMCAVVADEQEPVVLPDASQDPRFADNPWVAQHGVRFYASYQLRTSDDIVLGSLCVFDDAPRTIDASQHDQLLLLAGTVATLLEGQLRASAQAAEVRRLQVGREELLRSNADLTTFGAYLAHDLLNPVAGLRLSLEAARLELDSSSPDVATVDDMLHRAERSGGRVQAMLESLPAYARLGAQLVLEDVDVLDLVSEVVEDLPRHGDVELHVAGLPTVRADRLHLRSLLQNLLSNAVKFSGASTGAIPIEIRTGTSATGRRIDVVDHGPGIAADDLDLVLGAAARGRNADGVPGSGFGLTICRRIVEGHGGSLSLGPTPGGGLTVTLTLPAPC